MKIRDILTPPNKQLDEINLKQAVAAGMIGAAALSPRLGAISNPDIAKQQVTQQSQQADREQEALVSQVVNKYNIDPELAAEIVDVAHKYEHDDFPTAKDILAIVGIESSFRPHVKSQLKRDPARGLMQVRAGVWKLDPEELNEIEANIKHGSNILRQYYLKLRNKQAAVQAYNVGITDYRRGTKSPHYLSKYQREYGDFVASASDKSGSM